MENNTNDNKYNFEKEKFDKLLPEALKYAIEKKQVTTSMLQRRFSIGFSRASTIIEQMEEANFISKSDGSYSREIYITIEEYKEIFESDDEQEELINSNSQNIIHLSKKDDEKTQIENLTREEIDKKLKLLRETRNEGNSYKYFGRPAMAMCYCISFDRLIKYYKISLICSSCKEKNRLKTIVIDESKLHDFLFFYDEKVFANIEYLVDYSFPSYHSWYKSQKLIEDIREKAYSKQVEKKDFSIKKYNEEKNSFVKEKKLLEISEKEKLGTLIEVAKVKSIIEQFKSIGLDAELKYCCAECDLEHQEHFIVSVKAKDEHEWHKSIPNLLTERYDTTNTNEYTMAFNFLKYKTDSTDKLNYEYVYVGDKDSGLIKTKVDIALQKVLGLKIYYTKKEIANNIKVIFETNNLKSKIELALEILKLKSSIHSYNMNMYKRSYLYYLGKEEKITYATFRQNIYKYFKNGFITDSTYSAIIKELYEIACQELKITEINNIEEFKEYFIKHEKDFIKYIQRMYFIEKDYNSFLIKEAERLHLKTYQEFIKDYIASENYSLSLDEYIRFMQGLHMIFDVDINDDGVYKIW